MSSTQQRAHRRIDVPIGESVAGIVTVAVIAIYAYAIYHVPETPRVEGTTGGTAAGSLSRVLTIAVYPIRIAWPHVYLPFIPIAYVFSILYNIVYPLVVVLQCILYIVTWPSRIIYGIASMLYPLYVFFGVATLVGLAVGSGFAGVAHLVWFVAGAKG
ncbi:hypothetical protein CALCODRAFT_481341 [Calocera cornea HHB12733]|uniref:Uncharacterized protein n=1 Tax=Calocera cornea HHB12733 TaxID=1353952 RepID=A0A165HR39_9BASI|nr:hypothetical protein CALCODRAFT_481341 [Calocera cornea HHB12733]